MPREEKVWEKEAHIHDKWFRRTAGWRRRRQEEGRQEKGRQEKGRQEKVRKEALGRSLTPEVLVDAFLRFRERPQMDMCVSVGYQAHGKDHDMEDSHSILAEG